jgi:hypothetical protein
MRAEEALTCFPNSHQDEIIMTGCFEVSRRNWVFQFGELPSPCAWVEIKLTTKLTTERLDVLGWLWTMRRENPRIQQSFGHPWTSLHSAPHAPQPQVAGSIPVPPAREPEFMGITAPWPLHKVCALPPICPLPDTTMRNTAGICVRSTRRR